MRLRNRNKPEYRVILVESFGDKTYKFVKEKKVELNKDLVVSDSDKSVPITESCFQYSKGKTFYAFVDLKKAKIITIKEVKLGIDSRFLDKLISTSKIGIIGQWLAVIKSEMQEKKTDWGALGKPIVIFILGAVIGYFIKGGI